MEKLLIVDDEYLVREGLCVTVDWQSLGLEVVGRAENGAEGLELARALKPDLIISDVRMPEMDGLEMANTLFREGADLAVIVYSGYKDFEYARRALESNVAGFLLKPIDNGELVEKVREVLDKLHARRHEGKLLGQLRKNSSLLKRQLLSSLLNGEDTPESAAEQLALLGVNLPADGTVLCVRSKEGVPAALVAQFTAEFGECLTVSENFDDHCVLITSFDGEDRAVKKAVKVLDGALKLSKARYCVGVVAFRDNLHRAYAEALSLARNVAFTAVNSVVTNNDGARQYKKLVRDAIAIIERDFDKKISVKSVAEMLYTSESHLMHEFKEQTGKTFNSCLTDFRILRAEEMLLEGNMRVNEVAYAVGYTDVKYFGQVFKDYHGMTPSEFIRKRVDEDHNA